MKKINLCNSCKRKILGHLNIVFWSCFTFGIGIPLIMNINQIPNYLIFALFPIWIVLAFICDILLNLTDYDVEK